MINAHVRLRGLYWRWFRVAQRTGAAAAAEQANHLHQTRVRTTRTHNETISSAGWLAVGMQLERNAQIHMLASKHVIFTHVRLCDVEGGGVRHIAMPPCSAQTMREYMLYARIITNKLG